MNRDWNWKNYYCNPIITTKCFSLFYDNWFGTFRLGCSIGVGIRNFKVLRFPKIVFMVYY